MFLFLLWFLDSSGNWFLSGPSCCCCCCSRCCGISPSPLCSWSFMSRGDAWWASSGAPSWHISLQLDQLPGLLHHLTHSSSRANSSWACSFKITEHQDRPGLLGLIEPAAQSVLSSSTDATCISFASHLFTQANWWWMPTKCLMGTLCWVSKRSSKYTTNLVGGFYFCSLPIFTYMHNTGQGLNTVARNKKALWRRRHFLVQKRLPKSSSSSASKYLCNTHYPQTRGFFSSILWGVGRLVIICKRT